MVVAFMSGVVLGFYAGISPGPMLALVLSQSLRYGAREGCKTALTPLITDTPIVMLTLLAAKWVSQLDAVLGVLAIVGGLVVLYLAWENLGQVHLEPAADAGRPASLAKGVVTNLLNPHPWVFWMTVGAAMLGQTLERGGWRTTLAFLAGFYLLLVGSKIAVALAVGRSRHWVGGKGYGLLMKLLAALLACFAMLLMYEGARRLFKS